jgi:glutamine synthetase
MDLNYFAAMPPSVKACMHEVQAALLKIGCPLNVFHNEVAPGQHEISPFFTVTNISADLNQIAMQICCEAGARHGLVFLFHEKPFAGLNGSGKHNNWSVGTDTGINFFSPGKTDKSSELFAVAVACLTFALNEHNAVIRNSVAHAGNDHRLGAQEAPPAIISLMPGADFEQKVAAIVGGGALAGYYATGAHVDAKCANLNDVVRGIEDRNRTAPFPFCGNRFEFRAVGSSQSCAFPMAMVNTAMADGMRALSERLESGSSLRDAAAQLYKENQRVIFTGNNYAAEWPLEAARRGLPNLKDAVAAHHHFATPEAKALFTRMGVFTEAEVDARAECLFENYAATLEVEAATMVEMIETGVEAACFADLAIYAQLGRTSKAFLKRSEVYSAVTEACEQLDAALAKAPSGCAPEITATYCRDVLKPVMGAAREVCDAAEQLCRKDLWPFPSYTDCLFTHHFNAPAKT